VQNQHNWMTQLIKVMSSKGGDWEIKAIEIVRAELEKTERKRTEEIINEILKITEDTGDLLVSYLCNKFLKK